CRICIGSASGRYELPRFILRRESSFGWVSGGVLPLTPISYTREGCGQGLRQRVSDPAELHAQHRQPFSVSSGTAGTNLRKAARYARENCDPLQPTDMLISSDTRAPGL